MDGTHAQASFMRFVNERVLGPFVTQPLEGSSGAATAMLRWLFQVVRWGGGDAGRYGGVVRCVVVRCVVVRCLAVRPCAPEARDTRLLTMPAESRAEL